MSYIPKMPPFAAREKALGVSLPGEIPVTSVTEVTQNPISNAKEAIGLAPTARREITELVSQWLREECVGSWRCSSSVASLCRAFSCWAGLRPSGDIANTFADQLRTMGFLLAEGGMVTGLSLAMDFEAALEHERGHTFLPVNQNRNLKEGKSMSMIVSTKPKQYELPDEGEHRAVLCDIVDLGAVDTAYGKKDKVRFIWLVQQLDSTGKHIPVAYSYNKSLHEKASLRKVIKGILGRDPGDTFDLEKLLGINVRLVIEHVAQDDRTFANIAAILRPAKGEPVLPIPPDFVRAKDRNGGNGGNGGNDGGNGDAGGTSGVRSGRPKDGNGLSPAAAKSPRRAKAALAAVAKSSGNIHGLNVSDEDVKFPGDEEPSA